MLSAVSCSLSVCGLLKLKMTLVLIGAILTIYPGLDLYSQPPIWNPFSLVSDLFSESKMCRHILVQFFMADGCEFEDISGLCDSD